MILKIILVILVIMLSIFLLFTSGVKRNNESRRNIANTYLEKNDIPNALTYYLTSGDIDSIFDSIRIYRFDDNLKNVRKARYLLSHIIKNGNDVQREKARMILRDIQIEDNIDTSLKKTNQLIFNQMLRNNDILLRKQQERDRIENEMEILRIEEIVFNHLPHELKEEKEDIIRNDSQNVHDSDVVRSVKAGLMNIDNTNTNEMWDVELRDRILPNKKALDTYMKMMQNTNIISAYDRTERDVLKSVWSRINDPINTDIKNDMIHILEKQLEDGYGLCSMGRCTRALQTLEATDRGNVVKIKPEWAIKEEMLHTSSNLYKNMMDELKDKSILSRDENELNEEEKDKFNNFKDEYNKRLLDTFKRDYLDTLSNEFLEAKANEMTNAF